MEVLELEKPKFNPFFVLEIQTFWLQNNFSMIFYSWIIVASESRQTHKQNKKKLAENELLFFFFILQTTLGMRPDSHLASLLLLYFYYLFVYFYLETWSLFWSLRLIQIAISQILNKNNCIKKIRKFQIIFKNYDYKM